MTDTQDAVLVDLRATAALLQSAFAVVGANATAVSVEGEWSLADILNHVRASDAIISTRVYQVLTRDDVQLLGFDERAWGELYQASGIDPRAQLEQFVLRRAEFVAVLHSLTQEQFARIGQHEERGPMTVIDLCQMLADHEAEHRSQIERVIG